ncbi:MAG: UDP-N-acetylmuramoyl-tripeptide--D-alanyl-D-alanine ligase, partial [Deltaproteobacteria bacterium]|nr:UDP-N-acetylmuramoyl-tripeptide--D-alanyl-D-alanine ligase [Deltaproteobacteria bacterium]
MEFQVEKFVQATGAKIIQHGKPIPGYGVSTDTRTLQPGEIFFCLKGPHFDGHNFVDEAVKKNAWGIVTEQVPGPWSLVPGPSWVFQVVDPLISLGDLARWWRSRFKIPCVAITGSNGKTTVKEMTAAILQQRWSTLKTEGNFNNLIGLPLTLNRLTDRHQAAVLEMGMNAAGEIRRLTEIANPTIGLVTNATAAHLEKLQTVEAVARAKAELYEAMNPKGCAIYNAEDAWMRKEVQKIKGRKISFGMQPDSDVRFEHMENIGFDSMELKLAVRQKIVKARLKTTGIHNVMNAMAACAAALELGFDPKEMQAGLESFVPLKMRFEQTQLVNGVRLINDAYNANPVSMEMAFKTVSRQPRAGRFLA